MNANLQSAKFSLDEKTANQMYYSELKQFIIKSGETVYLALGTGTESTDIYTLSAETFTIANGKLEKFDLYQTPENRLSTIFVEERMDSDATIASIEFENQNRTMKVPLIDKDLNNTGGFLVYKFNGNKFVFAGTKQISIPAKEPSSRQYVRQRERKEAMQTQMLNHKQNHKKLLAASVVTLCPLLIANASNSAEISATAAKAAKQKDPPLVLNEKESKAAIAELRKHNLLFPISGFEVERVKNSYDETRGKQKHEAIDILAPRNTPILAVEDGVIAKLFFSKYGGITVYEFDKSKKYIYYYAHLEKYAQDLKDGDEVKRGQVLGFVGTSGDAPPDTPHLHFSISMPNAEKKWWQTAPLNPYLVFKK